MENIENEIVEKKTKGRVKKYVDGYEKEYKDTKYFNKYYHDNKKRIICDVCNKEINSRSKGQHNRTKSHVRFLELIHK